MRNSLPQSRSAHYLGLAVLLLAMTLGGVITLRCTNSSYPGGSLVPKPGVTNKTESGIKFTENVGSAEYILDTSVEYNNQDVPCVWRAVKSLDPMKYASSLEDFEPAGSTDVEMSGEVATIKVDPSQPSRSVYFVCEFQVGQRVQLRTHTVLVRNGF